MTKETEISKAVQDYLAQQGVSYTTETDGDTRIYTLSWYSPAGQDVNIQVECKRLYDLSVYAADEELASGLDRAYENYDASQEAYYWLGPDGHGKNGAPDTMGEVFADFKAVDDFIDELAQGVMETVKKARGA